MSYTPQTPIAGPTVGTPEAWVAYIKRLGGKRMDEVENFVREVYRLAPAAGISAHLIVGQMIHETDAARSSWWVERLNPAGIGITGDPAQNAASRTFPSGTIAARAMLVHVALYVFGELAGELALYRHEDPRADAIPGSVLGQRQTLQEFGDDDWRDYPTWAADDNYGRAWARRVTDADAAGVLTGTIEPPKEEPMAGYTAHDWSHIGFPGGKVYLPDHIEVLIKIIPSSVAGWTSGQRGVTGQRFTTWHDTGNAQSSAYGEYTWASTGGRAGINSPGSYNGIFDKDRIIITQRFDELVGHSATPQGNVQSWAFEQAFGPGFDASLPVGAALHGGICAAMGWSVDTALVQHRYWSGKWCPGQILNRGMWPQVQTMVADAARKARAAANGTDPAATVSVGDEVATTVNLNRRTGPGTGAEIVNVIPAGTTLTITKDGGDVDGFHWWEVDAFGWVAEGVEGTPYLVVTKDATPPQEPETPEEPVTYPAPLAIAELAPYVGRPIVPMPYRIDLAGGGVAFPVFDRVRALRDTPRRQAALGDARVGPDIAKGLEFDVSFLVLKEGQPDTYVTPWWTVVTAEDCEIVSDVPKDIQPAAGEAA